MSVNISCVEWDTIIFCFSGSQRSYQSQSGTQASTQPDQLRRTDQQREQAARGATVAPLVAGWSGPSGPSVEFGRILIPSTHPFLWLQMFLIIHISSWH